MCSEITLLKLPWWRHQMETFYALLAGPLCGVFRSPVNSLHKGQWRGALIFFLICDRINRWVDKQSWGWWFDTPSCSLWRHCDATKYSRDQWVKNPPPQESRECCRWTQRNHLSNIMRRQEVFWPFTLVAWETRMKTSTALHGPFY